VVESRSDLNPKRRPSPVDRPILIALSPDRNRGRGNPEVLRPIQDPHDLNTLRPLFSLSTSVRYRQFKHLFRCDLVFKQVELTPFFRLPILTEPVESYSPSQEILIIAPRFPPPRPALLTPFRPGYRASLLIGREDDLSPSPVTSLSVR